MKLGKLLGNTIFENQSAFVARWQILSWNLVAINVKDKFVSNLAETARFGVLQHPLTYLRATLEANHELSLFGIMYSIRFKKKIEWEELIFHLVGE